MPGDEPVGKNTWLSRELWLQLDGGGLWGEKLGPVLPILSHTN